MSVFKRKTTAGETKEYHFRFMQGGKLHFGVCEDCSSEKEAKDFEKTEKTRAKNLSVQKSVKALVENFRDELKGGDSIPMQMAFDMAIAKPSKHNPSNKQIERKRTYWKDFVLYMKKHYPEVASLSGVTMSHAEEYISYLKTSGRFYKEVTFKNHLKHGNTSVYIKAIKNLSPKTINMFHQALSEVFSRLQRDLGTNENPFAHIPKSNNDSESREPFTEDELKLIRDNWTPFIKRIFMTGLFTALREGDICTLKKVEVDFQNKIISRWLLKTGVFVEIPIMQPLEKFLREEIKNAIDSEYVFPDLAEMYLGKNPTGITYRVKNFLEGLGIKTTKKVVGRDRVVSIKDVHSCRHTFCYLAGIAGIPMVIVQSICGHMDEKMTQHYMAHATRSAKAEKMLLFPELLNTASASICTVPAISLTDRIQAACKLIIDSKMNATLRKQLLAFLQT